MKDFSKKQPFGKNTDVETREYFLMETCKRQMSRAFEPCSFHCIAAFAGYPQI